MAAPVLGVRSGKESGMSEPAASAMGPAIERMRAQYAMLEQACAGGDLEPDEFASHERIIALAAQVVLAETSIILAADAQARMQAMGKAEAAAAAAISNRFGRRN